MNRDNMETISLLATVGVIAYFPYVLVPVIVWLSGRYIYESHIKVDNRVKRVKEWIPYEEYQAYLLSDEWKELRHLRFQFDNGRCCECNQEVTIDNCHCHHITYARLTDELLSDVQTLCRRCHCIKHPHMS